jgi:hypothetical protein
MISHYLVNPILAERMSDDNLNKLASSHIARLKAYVPDPSVVLYGVSVSTIIAAMLSDTQTVYSAWRSSTEAESAERSNKSGRTITVDEAIADLKSFISRKEGVIADKFPRKSAVYKESFPLGLTEYSNLTKKNADTLLKRFITTLDAHKADFEASLLTEANAKYSTYESLREGQLESKGKVQDEIADSEKKRYGLSVQLYKNLVTLLLLNPEEPEKAKSFFDESFLKKKSNGEQPPAPAPQQQATK